MAERHTVEITYAGKRYAGEWWVDGGALHLESELGSWSGSPVVSGRSFMMPSEAAARMLRALARGRDPWSWLCFWR